MANEKIFGDLDNVGIMVYVENDNVYVSDNQEVLEIGFDCSKNRDIGIMVAIELLNEWSRG